MMLRLSPPAALVGAVAPDSTGSLLDRLPVPPSLVLFVVVAVVIGVARLVAARRRAAVVDTRARAVEDHGLVATERPLGIGDEDWGRLALLPRGEGRRSAALGLEGPVTVELGTYTAELSCASFEWWWERISDPDTTDGDRLRRLSAVVTAVRLPAGCKMPHTRVSVDDALARRGWGVGDDDRVGAEEFDRRFRVAVEDEEAAGELFTPTFQQVLLERFPDLSFELWGDLAVAVTDTDQAAATVGTDQVSVSELREVARRAAQREEDGLGHAPPDATGPATWPTDDAAEDRIGTRTDVVDALLDCRRTAVQLLSGMPEGWWRTVGVARD